MELGGGFDWMGRDGKKVTRTSFTLALMGVLLAVAVIVPAAASAAGTMHVKIEGAGAGEVSSVGGIGAFKNKGGANDATFESFGTAFEGSPPIECDSPFPGAGTCETPLVTSEALEGIESIALHAIGSEFVGWVVEEGAGSAVGCEAGGPLTEEGENPTFCLQGGPGEANGDIRVTATFGAPIVTELKPNKGLATGGNAVQIVGNGLANAEKVEFGGTVIDDEEFTENTGTSIKLPAPAHAPGTVHVTVTTAGGTSTTSAGDEYTFTVKPAVFKVEPTKGPAVGGNVVKITGTNLDNATKVEFGTTKVETFIKNEATLIELNAPAHAAGIVDVKVTTIGGTSAAVAGDKYTYIGSRTLAVTTAGTGSGSVTCNGGACAPSYEEGTSVTLAASAASGSTFTGWSGGGCSGTGNCVVTMKADTAVTANFSVIPPPPPKEEPKPPPPINCKVPKVKGLTLAKAKSALTKAHCKPGKVTKPKPKKGKKLGPLVVKSSTPGQGAVEPENTKVNLKLGPKPKKKG